MQCPNCGYIVKGASEFICRCGEHVISNGPNFVSKAKNFVTASLSHAKNRFRKVSDERRKERLEICKSCDLYSGKICTHSKCGCGIKSRAGFLDKLSWESESCPINKW